MTGRRPPPGGRYKKGPDSCDLSGPNPILDIYRSPIFGSFTTISVPHTTNRCQNNDNFIELDFCDQANPGPVDPAPSPLL